MSISSVQNLKKRILNLEPLVRDLLQNVTRSVNMGKALVQHVNFINITERFGKNNFTIESC